jgi:hypothetical protein
LPKAPDGGPPGRTTEAALPSLGSYLLRSGSPVAAPGCSCEPHPGVPHPAPPSRRLMRAPLGRRDWHQYKTRDRGVK